jgi:hypothetical protein
MRPADRGVPAAPDHFAAAHQDRADARIGRHPVAAARRQAQGLAQRPR